MKKSAIVIGSLLLGVWTLQAGAAPDVRRAFTTAAKRSSAARSVRVVDTAAIKAAPRPGSLAEGFENARNARRWGSRTDDLGNVHTTTRRLADDANHPGMRFESKQMITPEGTKYKTSTIIDSNSRTIEVRSRTNGGYLTGQANSRFGTR